MRLVTWNLRNGAGREVWPELAADLVFLQEADAAPQGDGGVWQRMPGERWGSAVISTVGRIRPITLPGYEGWVVGGEVDTPQLTKAAIYRNNVALTLKLRHQPHQLGADREGQAVSNSRFWLRRKTCLAQVLLPQRLAPRAHPANLRLSLEAALKCFLLLRRLSIEDSNSSCMVWSSMFRPEDGP